MNLINFLGKYKKGYFFFVNSSINIYKMRLDFFSSINKLVKKVDLYKSNLDLKNYIIFKKKILRPKKKNSS